MRFQKAIVPMFVFTVALNIFLWKINTPPFKYFDEVRYVPAGRQVVAHGVNENWSHPLLGKALLGLGSRLFGDEPAAPRIISAIFGSLALVVMYLWALLLFRSQWAALAVVLLCLSNQIHFVQSRIALLDVFMFAFMALGLLLFSSTWLEIEQSPHRRRWTLIAAGLAFGLSSACKWFGVVPWILCLVVLVGRQLRRRQYRAVFQDGLLPLLVVPLSVYFATYLTALGMGHPHYAPPLNPLGTYSVSDIWRLQLKMFQAQAGFTNPRHRYSSGWLSWPFMVRPLWLDYNVLTVSDHTEKRGILCAGNPAVLWTGFLAVLVCGWAAWRRKSKEARAITVTFLVLWLSWAIIPRQVAFFYYYYPAAMILSLALVQAARSLKLPRWVSIAYLVACAALFLFYYPILTDRFLTPKAFDRRVLFTSWQQIPGDPMLEGPAAAPTPDPARENAN